MDNVQGKGAPRVWLQRFHRAAFNYTTEAIALYTCLFFALLPEITGTSYPILLTAQKIAGLTFVFMYAGYIVWFFFKACRKIVHMAKALRMRLAAK